MPYTPLRENLFYMAWGKQSSLGTAVAPTAAVRWLDGTDANPTAQWVEEREGDTSPEITLVYKGSQVWKVTIKEKVRPIAIGWALQSHHGTGSDAYTGPTKNTTLSSSVAAGDTSFSSTADLGNIGASVALAVEPNTLTTPATKSEVVLVNLTTRSGSGPYTYTLVSGSKLLYAHSSTKAIQFAATHVFTRQPYTYDYCTIELVYGVSGSTPFQVFRLRDCVCFEVQLDLTKGKVVEASHVWYGKLDSTPASATFTPSTLPIEIGAPFRFDSAAGTWALDGGTTGNALTVEKVSISSKNSGSPTDGMSESLTPDFFLLGNRDLSVQATAIFNSWNQYNQTYFGSTSPGATGVDSATAAVGSLAATLSNDGINSLAISLPSLVYRTVPMRPRMAGGAIRQDMDLRAVKSAAQPVPMTLTLTNTSNAAY